MIRQGTFTFNGITSSMFGVWINAKDTYNAPKRKYKTVTVPGRNGSLTLDEGAFEEIEHTYDCFIINSFETNISGLRNALMTASGYLRLSDSLHPNEFYLARYMDGLEVDTLPTMTGGTFRLRFERDPRRFLTTGETITTLKSTGTITNPTLFNSRPKIRVKGTGTINVAGVVISVSSNPSYIDIDCEMQDCYYGTTNCNGYVTLSGDDFPVLKPGVNTITLNGITEAEITPNWFIL